MEISKFFTSSIRDVNLSFFINRPVLFSILGLFFIMYLIVTWVLMYHWSAYGMKSQGVFAAETLFIFVSLVLFVFLGLAIYYF